MNGSKFFLDLCFTFMQNGYERTDYSKEIPGYGIWITKVEYKLDTLDVILTLVEIHDGDTNAETVMIEQVGVTPEIVIYHKD